MFFQRRRTIFIGNGLRGLARRAQSRLQDFTFYLSYSDINEICDVLYAWFYCVSSTTKLLYHKKRRSTKNPFPNFYHTTDTTSFLDWLGADFRKHIKHILRSGVTLTMQILLKTQYLWDLWMTFLSAIVLHFGSSVKWVTLHYLRVYSKCECGRHVHRAVNSRQTCDSPFLTVSNNLSAIDNLKNKVKTNSFFLYISEWVKIERNSISDPNMRNIVWETVLTGLDKQYSM